MVAALEASSDCPSLTDCWASRRSTRPRASLWLGATSASARSWSSSKGAAWSRSSACWAARRRPALRLSEAVEPRRLSHSELYGDLLRRSGVEYGIAIGMRAGRGKTVVVGLGRTEREFSERDRDVLEGWLAEHFGAAEHPGWLPGPVAWWLALPPRPPLGSERDGRRLTVRLLPGDPHALLLEEEVSSFRPEALDRLGLTARETEVLRAAAATPDEAEIACELFLSLRVLRERLERLEAERGVRTAAEAVARALRESA